MPQLLYSQERTSVPTEQEAEWVTEPFRTIERKRRNFCAAAIIRTEDHLACSLVTVPTILSHLHGVKY
jgi:hypothetical protein